MSDQKQKNFLEKIFLESKAYQKLEDMVALVESGDNLGMIPMQPLYMATKNISSDELALLIPKLSKKQRQTLIDLDFWNKDVVSPEGMGRHIEAYAKLQDENLIASFVKEEDFLLYLKSRINIHTFDAEEPVYPEHNFYFLTDDGLLLIEYDEDFEYPHELQLLIRQLYSSMGVENAYAHLFKLINDSFSMLEEERYQEKKENLREFGFVDYYEANSKLFPFSNLKKIENFVSSKNALTPELDLEQMNQSLHPSSLSSFSKNLGLLENEVLKINDEKREKFLKFNFIMMVNSVLSINDAFRKGSVELTKISKETVSIINLSISYILHENKNMSVLEKFDFIDLYKIGASLIAIGKKDIKDALKGTSFDIEEFEYFLGNYWNLFLEDSFLDVPKIQVHDKEEITTYDLYLAWQKKIMFFKESIPFAHKFFLVLEKLKNEGKLNDEFYLNYQVENIDFEAILISSFINHALGNYAMSDVNKMGLTIGEFRVFIKDFLIKKGDEYQVKDFSEELIKSSIDKFVESFGFSKIQGFGDYLYNIISENIGGYDFDNLQEEDFKHIGGPILLNTIKN